MRQTREARLQVGLAGSKPSLTSLMATILSPMRFKVSAVAPWLGYWLLYATSGGILFYYPTDITPLLASSEVPNPYFLSYYSSFSGFYNSGIVWYPNGHLQINLLYGPTVFSILLSTLFSLNVVLTIFSLKFTRLTRRAGLLGALSLVPALFSGGCCSVPLGLGIIGIFAPTAGLAGLVDGYPFWVNLLFAILLSASLIYTGKKLAKVYRAPSKKEDEHDVSI